MPKKNGSMKEKISKTKKNGIKLDLRQVEQYYLQGYPKKSLQIIKDLEKSKDFTKKDAIYALILKSKILNDIGNFTEALMIVRQANTQNKEMQNHFLLTESLKSEIYILGSLNNNDEALELIKKCEEILKNLKKTDSTEFKRLKSFIKFAKGRVCLTKGNHNKAFGFLKKSLEIREELGNKYEIVESLLHLGIILWYLGDNNGAKRHLERIEKYEEVYRRRFNHRLYKYFGNVYSKKGENNIALNYYFKALTIAEELGHKEFISVYLLNIGDTYRHNGDFNQATEYLKRVLKIVKNIDFYFGTSMAFQYLFEIALEMDELEGAQQYLQQIQKRNNQEKSNWSDLVYRYCQALYLKKSPELAILQNLKIYSYKL